MHAVLRIHDYLSDPRIALWQVHTSTNTNTNTNTQTKIHIFFMHCVLHIHDDKMGKGAEIHTLNVIEIEDIEVA